MANQGLKEVSSVLVMNGDAILFGKRQDNLLWALPGGHKEENETPHQAAMRELFEETGVKPTRDGMRYLGHKLVGGGYLIHAFLFDVGKHPESVETMSLKHDPDQEFSELAWVHRDTPEWRDVQSHAHCPRNVCFEFMGIE